MSYNHAYTITMTESGNVQITLSAQAAMTNMLNVVASLQQYVLEHELELRHYDEDEELVEAEMIMLDARGHKAPCRVDQPICGHIAVGANNVCDQCGIQV